MRISEGCGTAILNIAPEVLMTALTHLPRAFRVIGSAHATEGFVRLIIESREIAEGVHAQMSMEIEDVGSTRVVRMRRCPDPPPPPADRD